MTYSVVSMAVRRHCMTVRDGVTGSTLGFGLSSGGSNPSPVASAERICIICINPPLTISAGHHGRYQADDLLIGRDVRRRVSVMHEPDRSRFIDQHLRGKTTSITIFSRTNC